MISLPRSQAIAETTPLLPRAHAPPYHLPTFLRVCRSPWPFISQRALLAVRAVIASFLTIVFTLDLLYRINHTQREQHFAFEASNISLVIQILYYWITMVGVTPLRCISSLINVIVLDPATHLSTFWSIVPRRTNQEQNTSPDTSRPLSPHVC